MVTHFTMIILSMIIYANKTKLNLLLVLNRVPHCWLPVFPAVIMIFLGWVGKLDKFEDVAEATAFLDSMSANTFARSKQVEVATWLCDWFQCLDCSFLSCCVCFWQRLFCVVLHQTTNIPGDYEKDSVISARENRLSCLIHVITLYCHRGVFFSLQLSE